MIEGRSIADNLKGQLMLMRERAETERYGRVLTEEEREANERLERQEEEAQKKAREAERLKEWVSSQLGQFPRRFADKTFGNYRVTTPAQKSAVRHLMSGRSAIIYGSNGTGKTHLAYASVRHQIEQGKKAQYVLAYDFFSEVRQSFADDSTHAVMHRYAGVDYLVIDEVDKSFGSKTEFVYLYTLVNRRYNDMLPTVLITNAGEEDLVSVMGASTISRVAGDGAIIELVGEDYRLREGLCL